MAMSVAEQINVDAIPIETK